MASINDFTLGDTVSFEVHPSTLLGTAFNNVKVLAILDMDSAKHWIDPVSKHINVYPTLPDGVPDDPEDYYYLKIKMTNGQITCLGLPWIKESTITVHESSQIRVIVDNVGPDDVQKITNALSANGFHATDVKLV